MTINCELRLHSAHGQPTNVRADLPRVPVAGDIIHHQDEGYTVEMVVLSTGSSRPYIKCVSTELESA